MRKLQRLSALVLAILLILSMGVTAYAHDYVQMDKKGSITITMRMGEKTVSGGTLTMYRVGEVVEDDGNYSFQPTGDFAGCGESFEDVSASTLPKNLAKYAKKITGTTKYIGTDGKVSFSNLKVGLYLFVQNKAASGYNKAAPFLVSLPYMEADGRYNYSVDASPKVELTKPSNPRDPKLPQTGQLNWPVPVLAIAGLTLFAAGWALYYGKRKDPENP